jgi:hypothetical protein
VMPKSPKSITATVTVDSELYENVLGFHWRWQRGF